MIKGNQKKNNYYFIIIMVKQDIIIQIINTNFITVLNLLISILLSAN